MALLRVYHEYRIFEEYTVVTGVRHPQLRTVLIHLSTYRWRSMCT